MAVNLYDSYCTAIFNLLTSTINVSYNNGSTGDTGWGMYVELRNGTVPLTPTIETVILYAIRPDGSKVQVVGEVEGNRLRFDFNDAIFQVSGTVHATMLLIDGNGLRKTSNDFTITAFYGILDAPYVTSADDFQLLQSAMNEMSNARQVLIDGASGLEATYAPRLTGVESGLLTKAEISYVDTKIASVASGSPKGTYATLVDLETAHPTGAEGIYIVSADGNWYFWNSTAWEAGGSYQGTELADGSVTSPKRTALGENIHIVKGANSVPNFSTSLKTFTIYNGTVILHRGTIYTLVGDVVLDCSTDNLKIIYNTVANTFRATTLNGAVGEGEIVFCSVRSTTHPYIFGGNFEYNINGEPKLSADMTVYNLMPEVVEGGGTVTVTGGSSIIMYSNGEKDFYPVFDTIAKTLTFPKGVSGSGFYVNGVAVALANTEADLVIDVTKAVTSDIALILLKKSDGTIHLIDGTTQFTADYVQLGTIMYGAYDIYPSFCVPYHLDDRFMGVINTSEYNPKDANVQAIAYKGYSSLAPENTLPAYALAKEKGFSYASGDVRWTSDGVSVLIADETIDRTSDGTGTVAGQTYDALSAFDFGSWKSSYYTDIPIPKFEEFILLTKKINIHPFIEIKGVIDSAKALTLVSTVRRLGMLRNVTWISETIANLNEILLLDVYARVGLIGDLTSEMITNVGAIRTATNQVFIGANPESIAPEFAEASMIADIPVVAWGNVDEANINTLVSMGVSGITSTSFDVGKILTVSVNGGRPVEEAEPTYLLGLAPDRVLYAGAGVNYFKYLDYKEMSYTENPETGYETYEYLWYFEDELGNELTTQEQLYKVIYSEDENDYFLYRLELVPQFKKEVDYYGYYMEIYSGYRVTVADKTGFILYRSEPRCDVTGLWNADPRFDGAYDLRNYRYGVTVNSYVYDADTDSDIPSVDFSTAFDMAFRFDDGIETTVYPNIPPYSYFASTNEADVIENGERYRYLYYTPMTFYSVSGTPKNILKRREYRLSFKVNETNNVIVSRKIVDIPIEEQTHIQFGVDPASSTYFDGTFVQTLEYKIFNQAGIESATVRLPYNTDFGNHQVIITIGEDLKTYTVTVYNSFEFDFVNQVYTNIHPVIVSKTYDIAPNGGNIFMSETQYTMGYNDYLVGYSSHTTVDGVATILYKINATDPTTKTFPLKNNSVTKYNATVDMILESTGAIWQPASNKYINYLRKTGVVLKDLNNKVIFEKPADGDSWVHIRPNKLIVYEHPNYLKVRYQHEVGNVDTIYNKFPIDATVHIDDSELTHHTSFTYYDNYVEEGITHTVRGFEFDADAEATSRVYKVFIDEAELNYVYVKEEHVLGDVEFVATPTSHKVYKETVRTSLYTKDGLFIGSHDLNYTWGWGDRWGVVVNGDNTFTITFYCTQPSVEDYNVWIDDYVAIQATLPYYTEISSVVLNKVYVSPPEAVESTTGDFVVRTDGKVLLAYNVEKQIFLKVFDTEEQMLATEHTATGGALIYTFSKMYMENCFSLLKLTDGKILLFVDDGGNFADGTPFALKVFESANGLGDDFALKSTIFTANRTTANASLTTVVGKATQDSLGNIWLFALSKMYTYSGYDLAKLVMYKSSDGGLTWVDKYTYNGGILGATNEWYIRSMVAVENSIFVTTISQYAGQNTYLYISTDGGETWTRRADGWANLPPAYTGLVDDLLIDFVYDEKSGYVYMIKGNDSTATTSNLYKTKPTTPITYEYLDDFSKWILVQENLDTSYLNAGHFVITPRNTIHYMHTAGMSLWDLALFRSN